MRRSRFATLAASGVALLLTTAAVAPAGAATSSGVGTSQASTSLLNVVLGGATNALNLNILSDKAQSSIDPKVSDPARAIADLSPLRVASSLIPSLNQSVPGLHAESTGTEEKATTPAIPISLGSFASGSLIGGGTLTPPSLSALVDSNGAVGGITAGLKNFSAVAGLLSIPNASINLGAKALKSDASGLRGINIDSLDLANIGAILRGLGVDPSNLPLSTVTGLLDKLGLPLAFGGQSLDGNAIQSLVSQVTSAISGLTGVAPISGGQATQLNGLIGTVTGTVGSLVGGTTPATGTGSAQSALQTTLTNLLNSTLGGLLNSPLLSVKNIVVGLNTKAADTVANSLAGVTAKIGSIKVGAVDLGGVDLGAAVSQVSGLVDTVNNQLSQVLNVVGLGNLLKIGLFTQDKQVNEAGGYTHALASLSALHLALTPPAAISSIVSGLTSSTGLLQGNLLGSSVSSLLTGPGAASSVPVLGGLMQTLNGLLPGANGLGALTNGVSADVLKIASTSDFALVGAAAAPAPVSELPMTGGNHLVFVVGLLFLVTGAGLVRFVRASRSAA